MRGLQEIVAMNDERVKQFRRERSPDVTVFMTKRQKLMAFMFLLMFGFGLFFGYPQIMRVIASL